MEMEVVDLVSVGFDEALWEVGSGVEVGKGLGCSGLSSGACTFWLDSLFVSVDSFSDSWMVKSISKVPLFAESLASHLDSDDTSLRRSQHTPKPFASNFGNDPISTSFLYPSLYLQTVCQLG